MRYDFKYKKQGKLFFKTIKKAKGHSLNFEANRMDIFLDDGIISIAQWDKHDMKLGSDFILFQKAEMEKETGLDIKIDGSK